MPATQQGATAKMLMDESTVDTMSLPVAFVSESLKADRELIQDEGIRGTRSRSKERVTTGLIRVGGQTVHRPSPTELNELLPWILGTDEATDIFAVADALQEVNIAIQRGAAFASAGMWTYAGCKCAKAVFSGSEGSPIQVAMDWIGKTVTVAAGTAFPSVAMDTDGVYIFQGGVLTLEGASQEFSEFSLTVDNFAESEFNNSQTASSIDAQDRMVQLTANLPWNTVTETLWATANTDSKADGAAGSLVFLSNLTGQLLTFTFANCKPSPLSDPTVGGKSKIRLPTTWDILQSTTTKEIVVTHDGAV